MGNIPHGRTNMDDKNTEQRTDSLDGWRRTHTHQQRREDKFTQ